jgi:threonine aldolase
VKPSRSFASDNNAGVHPEILKAIESANEGHVVAYGSDRYTNQAVAKFKEVFGKEIEVFFVFNGTAANVLSLGAMIQSYEAVICSSYAHLNLDECGAPEKFTGCKLLLVPTADGKITVEGIKKHCHGFGEQHHVQPKVISITQVTELGTVYSDQEVKVISKFAHENEMYLHMDGARIANAAVSLGLGLKEATKDLGVDVLSFGGTKNGLLFGEAVVFFNSKLAKDFLFKRKQSMQLASKMRFISAQFEAILSNDLWLKNAAHSNAMAEILYKEIQKVEGVKIPRKTQANSVFAQLPKKVITALQKKYFFYVWDEDTSEVRWMTSFDTQENDIHDFVKALRAVLK